ncbi:Epoxide hydrolase hydrolase [Mycena kentingensis (nom. inval.)]|nr:Epoxide hydrolase hydrolase [Mycena kentingensis (nom. inval.)]
MPKIRLPSGYTWAYVDANPTANTTLLCLHGFPDLAFGYRHQIGAWARAGFRVVVPDMLGYGATDAPDDPKEYTMKRLTSDLAALLTALGVGRAVMIGHDWGSFTAGRFALWHPERLLGLVLMSVPFTPPTPKAMPLDEVVVRAPNLGYQLYIASEESVSEMYEKIPYVLSLTFAPNDKLVDFTPTGKMQALIRAAPANETSTSLLHGDAMRAYVAAFKARGMRGPTNYYRTSLLRFAEESTESPPLAKSLPESLPVLGMYGVLDATIPPAALKTQRRFVPRLREVMIAGTGHWVMIQDVPAAEEPRAFLEEGTKEDPLRGWREKMSAGAWKDGRGDGGPVGRSVVEWLAGLGIYGDTAEKGKL